MKAVVNLRFFNGRRGNIISRLPNGKIALVNRSSPVKPKTGEKWECRVDLEKPNFVVVTPIARIVKKAEQRFRVYKCGHRELVLQREVEIAENKEPEHSEYTVDYLCPECAKSCEHRNLEISWSSFWFAVNCKDCRETLYTVDFDSRDEDDQVSEILEVVRQRFSQVYSEAERTLRLWAQWSKEYREKSKEFEEVKQKISNIKKTVRNIVSKYGIDTDFSEFKVEDGKILFEYVSYYKSAPEEPYSISVNYIELIEQGEPRSYVRDDGWPVKQVKVNRSDIDKIRELRDELDNLEKQRSELHWWLTENRPVE